MIRSTITVVTLLMIFISGKLSAQHVPNGTFEIWDKFGTYENPRSWTTPNSYTAPLFAFSVTKEIGKVHSGLYTAKLRNTSILGGMAIVPGFMTIGDFEVNTSTMEYKVYGGVPFAGKPSKLKGYNQYYPESGDKWFIVVGLFKWDSIAQKQDTIGMGYYESGVKDSIWNEFEVNINYFSQQSPDTMNIIVLSSSSDTPPEGSTLYIDSLWLDYNTSIHENNGTDFTMYPNPANGQVIIGLPPAFTGTILIQNLYGQEIYEQKISGLSDHWINLDVSGYKQGIYLITIKNQSGRLTKRLIIN